MAMASLTPTTDGTRGSLIVFEGLDRSGKTTQCQRLASHLRLLGEPTHPIRFPDRSTPIGQMINSYLLGQSETSDQAIHLLFSANRWEAASHIEQHLLAGHTVIIDRYYYSGCVYSAAKNNEKMSLEWCRHMEVGLPRPDLCLFLDVSAEEQARRGGFGEERYEKAEMQQRVRELFGEMGKHQDEGEDLVRIDANGSEEEVWTRIVKVVEQRLGGKRREERRLRYVNPW